MYNSFENKVIFLDPQLKELLEYCIEENMDELENIHPDFYHYLVETKFLVDENLDEVALVKELSKKVDEDSSTFLLIINPTMNCNFKCWYCYETQVKNSQLEDSVLESINLFITKTLQKEEIKHFSLSFFGGEPLLYFKKKVIPIIDHFLEEMAGKEKTYDIGFTTNGYLINDDFIRYFKEKKLSPSFQITFDGYGKEHDAVRFVSETKGSYNDIVENIKKLLRSKFSVSVRINYTDKNIHNCFKIVDDFAEVPQEMRNSYLVFDFHRVWQNESLDNTSEIVKENTQIMQEKGFKTSVKYSLNKVLGSCYADKRNSAIINYNGDIYKCTARDFLPKNRNGYLSADGDLVWADNYLEERMNSKFHNQPCLSCRILPLCNGACTQQALEHLKKGEDYCIYQYDENEINKVVRTKIEDIVNAQLQEA